MRTKTCTRCLKLTNIEEFSKSKDGKDGLRSWCKSCDSIVKRQYYYDNRDAALIRSKAHNKRYRVAWWKYKDTLKCVKCGFNHPAALDFHHKNPATKKFDISYAVARRVKLTTIQKEIKDNCDVLCSNCHRIHHYDERQ